MIKKQFIEMITPYILQSPSPVKVSVRIAQACLESNYGLSELAIKAHNFFGIKNSYPWTGPVYSKITEEFLNGHWTKDEAEFRFYVDMETSCLDQANFFESTDWRKLYYDKVIQATSVEQQVQALTGTYATDPEYGEKLLDIIKEFSLSQYDGKEVKEATTPVIIDRRQEALGGQRVDRNKASIKRIVWHYTGVERRKNRKIWDHEVYWKQTHGWDRGGYHYYIDSDSKIYWNYNLKRITWGVYDNNKDTVHISLEANSSKDYSLKQIQTRDWLTRKLMNSLNLSPASVLGHWEVYNNTACPGYTKQEMDQFRLALSKKPLEEEGGLEGVSQLRDVPIFDYVAPANPFTPLAVGSLVTIRPGFDRWFNPQDPRVGIKPSQDFSGTQDTVTGVIDVHQSHSCRAYRLEGKNSWILEEDLMEAYPEDSDNAASENYLFWQGVRYTIGGED